MKKLEELFDLPRSDELDLEEELVYTPEETKTAMAEIDDAIDKIDAALPGVRDLSAADSEMDELADLAKGSYEDLMDLGMNVDSRFAAEIFSVAGAMLGHALTAKQAKLNKKLKMIDLQLKKANLDMKQPDGGAATQLGQGHVLDRNELLDRLLGDRKTNAKKG
jgi:hypothetical protein